MPSRIVSCESLSYPAGKAIAAPENKIFYPALDGLRGTAVLLVFLEHYELSHKAAYLDWGWAGVDIFFVLSGFLITGILFDSRNDERRWKKFYIRRSLRIFPLYYGLMAAVLLLTPLLHWNLSRRWLLWPLYLGNYMRLFFPATWGTCVTLLDSLTARGVFVPFGHLWSLCVEEQFYLAWPLLVFLVKDRVRLRNLCVLVVAVLPLVRLALYFVLPPRLMATSFLYSATPFRVDALLLGGALALMLRGPESTRVFALVRPLLATVSLVFALTWVFAVRVLHQPASGIPCTPWIATFGFTLLDLAAAGVLLLCLRPGGAVHRVFMNKPLRRLGQISYGFYVFHDIPHVLYIRLVERVFGASAPHQDLLTMIVALVGTMVLAFVSFRFFEAPFLRLKDRFAA